MNTWPTMTNVKTLIQEFFPEFLELILPDGWADDFDASHVEASRSLR